MLSVLLQVQGKLRARSRLPGSLNPGHHDHRGVPRWKVIRTALTAERPRELIANDLDHLLRRRQASEHFV
jgi:hypothetical protein